MTEKKKPEQTEPEAEAGEKAMAMVDRTVEYMPLGESTMVELTVGMVRTYLARPTAKGAVASDAEIIKFMMLCKARELNPWVGDVYLIGFDDKTLGPVFTLITAIQALEKRAEANPQYDGIESGVIVQTEDGHVDYRVGDITFKGETLLGGWAKVWRKDRKHPFYQALRLDTYDKQRSRWKADPSGMIVKCSEAGAYRAAFPTQLGKLYTMEERDTMGEEVLPPMPEGRQEIFTGPKRSAVPGGAEVDPVEAQASAAHETVADAEATVVLPAKPGYRIVVAGPDGEAHYEKVEPEPGTVDTDTDDGPAGVMRVEPKPAAPSPKPKPTTDDLSVERFNQLVTLFREKLDIQEDDAISEVEKWLKRLGYKVSQLGEDDTRWTGIILKRANRKIAEWLEHRASKVAS